MESAINSMSTTRPAAPASPRLSPGRTKQRALQFAGILICVLPLLLAGISLPLAVSSDNYATLAQVLIARDRGQSEVIMATYPPVTTIILLLWSSPLALMLAAALAGGAWLWRVGLELSRQQQSPLLVGILLAMLIMTPACLYLGTHEPALMLLLLLVTVAMHHYFKFVNLRATYHGFMAGLMLGLSFYVSLYGVLLTVLLVLATPVYMRANRQRLPETITAMSVVGFPMLMAFITWAYLTGIFTGDAFGFLASTTTPVVIPAATVLRLMQQDLFALPLYVMTAIVLLVKAPRRLPLYLAFLPVVALLRLIGVIVPEALVLVTGLLLAVLALPGQLAPRWSFLIGCAAVLQIAVGIMGSAYSPELRLWRDTLDGRLPAVTTTSINIADPLRTVPPKRILAEGVEEFIIQAETAAPFVLPGESRFTLALGQPAALVDYILMPELAGSTLYQRFGTTPPTGFVVEAHWQGWLLLQRAEAAPLLELKAAWS